MRVALVTNAPPASGMGKPARALADALRAIPNLTVDVVDLDARDAAIRVNGALRSRLPVRPRLKPLAWLLLGSRLDLAGYDVVHLTNQSLSFLARRTPAPTIVTVWDLIERLAPQERGGGLAARVLYRGIPHARHVIAVSSATAETVRALYPAAAERLTVIPPAVSPQFAPILHIWETAHGKAFLAKAQISPGTPTVLYVGSEHPRKNLPRLLEALARVRPRVPDVRLVKIGSAGSARGRAQFAAAADRLGLWPIITRIEEAHDPELRYWYQAATVLAFPSLLEGFGFPPLEALACGTPVVTSDRSSLPEVVGDAAVVVNPERVEEITDGLHRVLTDEGLRRELRRRGLARAAQFRWETTARETLAVYEKVRGQR